MSIEAKATDNNTKVHRRRILIPVDRLECSLNAAKYAIKFTEDENAHLFVLTL
jgi:hypothetical protein